VPLAGIDASGGAQMNTTGLIAHWSMSGAREDLSGQFRSVSDLEETPSSPEHDRIEAPASPLLVRQPDEAEWRPLLLAAHEGGEPGR
jgi:hypothetical protein